MKGRKSDIEIFSNHMIYFPLTHSQHADEGDQLPGVFWAGLEKLIHPRGPDSFSQLRINKLMQNAVFLELRGFLIIFWCPNCKRKITFVLAILLFLLIMDYSYRK